MWKVIEHHDLIDDTVIAGVEENYEDDEFSHKNAVIHLIGAPKVIFPINCWPAVKKTIDSLLNPDER